ncbi:MAG TPA: type II 3-dehydroquinate dehydratase [Euzebya sp.]|nr:type II 3-dehydroquinate dehydratase [Euzebya sp.]
MRILLLNGPNLNLLGTRNPEVYGSTTLPELEAMFRGWAAALGITEVEAFQSNHEGELIDRIHAARADVDGIVFNPGALTHTSYALHDAIEAVEVATVETHISDVEAREEWRRISTIRPACVHTVYGRGIDGYRWALQHLVARRAVPVQRLDYGPSPDQFADLRLPAGEGPFPLAVTVHGGFWRHRWTRETIELAALDLTARGMASLNVEYRRVGDGGGGTASLDDVVEAIFAGLEHPMVNSSRWAILGHSAGGQLGLVAARILAGADDRAPRLAVSLAGVVDLVAAIEDDLGEGAATAYLGAAAPTALSPLALLPLRVRTLMAHGTADDRVPFSQSQRYVDAATAAGEEVELLAGDHDHFAYLDPGHPAWIAVAERVAAALA